MNLYLIVIIVALAGKYLLSLAADYLNLGNISEDLPSEFSDCYDAKRYRTSQSYLRENTRFGLVVDTVDLAILLALILAGGFELLDRAARSPGLGPIPTGLLFAGILTIALGVLHLPFSVYGTFVIEEKYGFNTTTARTFVMDIIKSIVLNAIVGGGVFAGILWFFGSAGQQAWLYCWAAVASLQILLVFLAPILIMPLFNKFDPLEEGALRSAIEEYARDQEFMMKGVFKMDGSKRSAKSNAFFTGFGRSRRIVLYDTLIAKHTVPELVAIVAHEMGHYKKRHVWWAIARATAMSGLTFFLMSQFINNEGLFSAFGMRKTSIYASLVFFGFLYAPISTAIALIEHAISRKQEYAADTFAAAAAGDPAPMIAALKKLSIDNLSNLRPHPLKVFVEYSHPPVLERIAALKAFGNAL